MRHFKCMIFDVMGTVIYPSSYGEDERYFTDNWVLDSVNKSPEVVLSSNSKAAYFHINPVTGSRGTAGVRGNRGFDDGEHYWEVDFPEPAWGTSVMIGVGTKTALLHTSDYRFIDLIGMDNNSWGLSYKGTLWHGGICKQYCDPFFQDKIGVHLNMYTGTLTYYKNGISLGIAFTGLNQVGEELYPLLSSTAEETEMEVGHCKCRYLSLQEKCCLTVAKTLRERSCVNELPLPPAFKKHIYELK